MATKMMYSTAPYKERQKAADTGKTTLSDNCLAVVNPDLAAEWHPTKNGDLTPSQFAVNSGKKVWWMCKLGHEWPAEIANRNAGRGCPYCSNKKILKGYNDLASVNPAIALEWHPWKNGKTTPDMVSSKSSKKVWWICDKGHEWPARISHRNNGSGCPYCSGRQAWKGYNDLATLNPDLAAEWHPTKNGNLTPEQFTVSSGKKVWWRCERGHEWQAVIASRNNGNGCSKCAAELQTSFAEQAIYYYVKKQYKDAINRDLSIGQELDVYIPSIKTAVEYDGAYFHRSKQRDLLKNRLCEKCGIRLIRIREKGCPKLEMDDVIIREDKNDGALNLAISTLLKKLNAGGVLVDVEKDRPVIYSQYVVSKKQNSLAKRSPELILEWNREKNGTLEPEMMTPFSNKRVWWKCKEGHEWKDSINARSSGCGCPYCSGHRVWKGFNDLATFKPDLASEWHPTKNGIFTPDMFTVKSGKKVWWKCSKGHEWPARISQRSNGAGCPYCAGQRAIIGVNDLATLNPELASEWHPTKNKDLKPDMFMPYSGKKVWWLGKCGHEWPSKIENRTAGRGCPICHKLKRSLNI